MRELWKLNKGNEYGRDNCQVGDDDKWDSHIVELDLEGRVS